MSSRARRNWATLTEWSLAHAETGSTAYWTSVIAVPRHQTVGSRPLHVAGWRGRRPSARPRRRPCRLRPQPPGLEERRVADPRQSPDDFLFLDGGERARRTARQLEGRLGPFRPRLATVRSLPDARRPSAEGPRQPWTRRGWPSRTIPLRRRHVSEPLGCAAIRHERIAVIGSRGATGGDTPIVRSHRHPAGRRAAIDATAAPRSAVRSSHTRAAARAAASHVPARWPATETAGSWRRSTPGAWLLVPCSSRGAR